MIRYTAPASTKPPVVIYPPTPEEARAVAEWLDPKPKAPTWWDRLKALFGGTK